MAELYISVTGDKGGVGKSTIACLLAEWLKHKGKSIKLIDADPNQTSKTWVDKCSDKGYEVSSDDGEIVLVDTAGTSGSSLTKHISVSDVIVVPFQPHVSDLETVIGWYLSLKGDLQDRVCFIPNRMLNTKEQTEGISQLKTIINEEGKGRLLPGLFNRPAIYPSFLNGDKKNFFERELDEKTSNELENVFSNLIPVGVRG